MAFLVVADAPADEFRALAARRPGRAGGRLRTELEARGQAALHDGHGCARCHAIAGRRRAAALGPDLTHLASRRTIAAGTLDNDRRHARRAGSPIRSALKPGNRCRRATVASPAKSLRAVAAYLASLK